MMTSFFILLSSIYSHSVHFQNLLWAEKLFHFKFLIGWYITLTCLSNFNFEVFLQAAIMNYAQYGVMAKCFRWGFLICVSWYLPLILCRISTLYVFFSSLTVIPPYYYQIIVKSVHRKQFSNNQASHLNWFPQRAIPGWHSQN